MITRLKLPLMLLCFTCLMACNKDQNKQEAATSQGDNVEIAMDASRGINTITNTFFAVLGALDFGADNVSSRRYDCYTVTVSPGDLVNFPKTVTVEYDANCNVRGNIVSGKVIFVIDQWMYNQGAVIKPVFQNFVVNGNKIEGDIKIVKTSPLDSEPEFDVTYTNVSITDVGNDQYIFDGTQHFTQVGGIETPAVIGDDHFTIAGAFKIRVPFAGLTLDAKIQNPLQADFVCADVKSGTIELSALFLGVGLLDFGNGNCDGEATLRIGNMTYPFNLKPNVD